MYTFSVRIQTKLKIFFFFFHPVPSWVLFQACWILCHCDSVCVCGRMSGSASQVSVHDPCQVLTCWGLWISQFTNMKNVTCSVTRNNNYILLPSCDMWQCCHFTGMWKYTGFIPMNVSLEWSVGWRHSVIGHGFSIVGFIFYSDFSPWARVVSWNMKTDF